MPQCLERQRLGSFSSIFFSSNAICEFNVYKKLSTNGAKGSLTTQHSATPGLVR